MLTIFLCIQASKVTAVDSYGLNSDGNYWRKVETNRLLWRAHFHPDSRRQRYREIVECETANEPAMLTNGSPASRRECASLL
jgi:hypothetical protein